MIQVTDLTVRVPGFALERVTFTIPTGGVGIVTGPTGAGKTTLIEAIAGVRAAQGGEIVLSGSNVSRQPPEQRNVGLVYQQGWLFPHLSVRENIAYGTRRDGAVGELVERLQLGSLLARPVPTLSGGERQLVALARALAREPQTVLLDEPFAAMDSTLRVGIRATVLAWVATRGATTLLVTHDAAEATLTGSIQLRVEGGVVRITS